MHISKPFSLRELTQFKGKFILYLRLKTVTYAGFSRQKKVTCTHSEPGYPAYWDFLVSQLF